MEFAGHECRTQLCDDFFFNFEAAYISVDLSDKQKWLKILEPM